jgi:DNA (cytosine-5)-methyltransferase 1
MESEGWRGAKRWAKKADKIAPTIVGGSKKHGGADLGPTRAKQAWRELGVNALGVANSPPGPEEPIDHYPMLTTEMVARIQGWEDLWGWEFIGRKTSRYRQIGNAFPPPVAEAVGTAIQKALRHHGTPKVLVEENEPDHDLIYRVLRENGSFMSGEQIAKATKRSMDAAELERHISLISRDFHIEIRQQSTGPAYRLGEFKAFLGQHDHSRHEAFLRHLAKIS